jgi:serine/threonine-protein kinase
MQKAMAKTPAERYQTPQEFIAALEQLQERIQAMPPSKRVPEPGHEARSGNIGPAKPPVAPPKQARLVVISSGQSIPLTSDLMVVGRQDPILGIFPEINLADKTVGRRHAYLRNQQGMYTVEDLNALNKTRLNGVTLTPHEERTLKDGDILRFGSVEVRFELR